MTEQLQQYKDQLSTANIIMILLALSNAIFISYFFIRWQQKNADRANKIISDREIQAWWDNLSYDEWKNILIKNNMFTKDTLDPNFETIKKFYFTELTK